MSTPSSAGTGKRGLRDHPLGRLLLLGLVLFAAVLVARGCGSGAAITKDEAIAKAKPVVIFEYESVQVRYVQRGLPTRGFWAVSFYTGKPTNPTTAQVVMVDAKTGEITDDGRP